MIRGDPLVKRGIFLDEHKILVAGSRWLTDAVRCDRIDPFTRACRLIADRAGNETASEVVSDAESAGADDDDYEAMMLKRRKLEKRMSSHDRTAGNRGRSFTGAKEYVNAVLYQDFRATDALEWWRSEGSVKYPNMNAVALKYLAVPATSASIERCFSHAGLCVVGKKNHTQDLLNNKLMHHLNENISR